MIESLKLTESQTQGLAELQKHVDAEVGKVLTDEQKSQLEEMQQGLAGGADFGAPGFGPPRFGPPGFGPGRGGRDGFRPPGGGPRGGPGGPGGLFRSYRYAADYAGLAGKDLAPGKYLLDVVGNSRRPQTDDNRP
jgi:hypothetical protein